MAFITKGDTSTAFSSNPSVVVVVKAVLSPPTWRLLQQNRQFHLHPWCCCRKRAAVVAVAPVTSTAPLPAPLPPLVLGPSASLRNPSAVVVVPVAPSPTPHPPKARPVRGIRHRGMGGKGGDGGNSGSSTSLSPTHSPSSLAVARPLTPPHPWARSVLLALKVRTVFSSSPSVVGAVLRLRHRLQFRLATSNTSFSFGGSGPPVAPAVVAVPLVPSPSVAPHKSPIYRSKPVVTTPMPSSSNPSVVVWCRWLGKQRLRWRQPLRIICHRWQRW